MSCRDRLEELVGLEHSRNNLPDIIAMQDPPTDIMFQGQWDLDYNVYSYATPVPSSEQYKEDRKLSLEEFIAKYKFARVAFLVLKSIDKKNCFVLDPPNEYGELVRSLKLVTDRGTLTVHNIYNHNKRLPLEILQECCGENCVIVSDTNGHGELWIQVDEDEDCTGQAWSRTLRTSGMLSMLQSGKKTYSRGVEAPTSTIDCVFAHKSLAPLVAECDIVDHPRFNSDHRILGLKLNAAMGKAKVRRKFMPADCRESFEDVLSQHFQSWVYRPIDNVSQLMCLVRDFIARVNTAVDETMPWTEADTSRKPSGPMGEALSILREMAARADAGTEDPQWKEHYQNHRDFLRHARIGEFKKKKRWRIAKKTDEDPLAIYRLDRLGKQRSNCPVPPLIPPLSYGHEGDTTKSHDETATLLVNTLWHGSCKTSALDHPPEMPQPDYTHHKQMPHVPETLQTLRRGEVRKILRHLKPRSAPGPSRITVQALKWGCDVLVKPMKHIFQACLSLPVHPYDFQRSITKMILKLYKDPTKAPNYRPIDLCCKLGSILEKLVARRFADLVEMNDLLPHTQFGQRGKDTTMALQHLVNWVYSGWHKKYKRNEWLAGDGGGSADDGDSVDGGDDAAYGDDIESEDDGGDREESRAVNEAREEQDAADDGNVPRDCHWKTSVLSLDMSGAYNNTDRGKLLQTLVDYGFPKWMVEFTRSFMENRITVVDMGGVLSPEEYWLGCGLPQGSPMSPILFLLFVGPILNKLPREDALSGAYMTVFAYVDDFYLVVSSPSYETN